MNHQRLNSIAIVLLGLAILVHSLAHLLEMLR